MTLIDQCRQVNIRRLILTDNHRQAIIHHLILIGQITMTIIKTPVTFTIPAERIFTATPATARTFIPGRRRQGRIGPSGPTSSLRISTTRGRSA
jgi:hypothetical protein